MFCCVHKNVCLWGSIYTRKIGPFFGIFLTLDFVHMDRPFMESYIFTCHYIMNFSIVTCYWTIDLVPFLGILFRPYSLTIFLDDKFNSPSMEIYIFTCHNGEFGVTGKIRLALFYLL